MGLFPCHRLRSARLSARQCSQHSIRRAVSRINVDIGMGYVSDIPFTLFVSSPLFQSSEFGLDTVPYTHQPSNTILCTVQRTLLYLLFIPRYVQSRFGSYLHSFQILGMLFCTRREWFKASICFALAGCFRSNGIFLSGFILWGLVVQPFLARQMVRFQVHCFLFTLTCLLQPKWQNLVKATAYTAVVFAPFITHHIFSYLIFCSGDDPTEAPVWCSHIPPSIYTYVQSKYWDNGFLAYWTLNQLPNFLISAPTISLMTMFSMHHLNIALSGKSSIGASRPFRNPTITPHAIHALVLTSILVFSSNVQIILRLAASMPIIYWAAAWLLLEHPKLGRLWVVWSILWSVISTILWATFLPPA